MVTLNFEKRLSITEAKKQKRVEEILAEIDAKIMSECSFKPILNEKSIKLMSREDQRFRGTDLLD